MKKLLIFSFILLFFNALSDDNLGDIQLKQTEFKTGNLTIQFKAECGKLCKTDSGVTFTLQLKEIKGNVKSIKLLDSSDEIELKNEKGWINSEFIKVSMPDERVRNEKFTFEYTIILITSDNKDIYTNLTFEISPTVFIRADDSKVNLGTLIYENCRVRSTKTTQLPVHYSVLKDAQCKIKSTNNFYMKHQDGCSIKYTVTSDKISDSRDDPGVKLIDVPKNTSIVNLCFSVDTYVDRIPTAGQYSDVLVLSIIPKETK